MQAFQQLVLTLSPVLFFYVSLHVQYVLCFCFSGLISMVTAGFQGIREAEGLEGVKADGWLSHE